MDEIETARAAIDAFNSQDDASAEALFHPEGHEIVPLRAALEDTVYTGPDAWRQFIEATRESWSRIRMELEDARPASEGRVLLIATMVAAPQGAELEVSMRCGFVVSYRDGLIARMCTYTDVDEAIRVAGEPD